MPNEKTKAQVIRALKTATYNFTNAVNSCNDIQDIADLPEAFSVISKHLPVVSQTLNLMSQNLENGEETPEIKEKYTAVYQLAEMCREQADYLQDIFAAVTAVEGATERLEQYRDAVNGADDTRIESAMQNLLKQAVNVATVPLVDEDLVKQLQIARQEVAALRPSLKEDNKGRVMLINKAGGTQFYHGGKGHQNHCSGGIQITGNDAHNHIASDKYDQAEKT
ncbi:hypothetical protein F4820DRAFT_434583 [Hypoxylon rubiginosum]|uniref:Uncharacterized protein n=1 Tax=Hypoxylon rubiginosum TaxID=110542 RepID=A0ACB9YQX5_9PEZI|nr:hypothetical protein F4820DRAFT_434583 [Hypoxylon rubiginosum]